MPIPRPYRSPAQAVTIGLLATTDHVRRYLEAVIAPFGVTQQQYNVLRILRGAGEPLPTYDIAERMVEQTPGITRLLDRIEAKGLVRRTRCTTDRRQILCELTADGHTLLRDMDAVVDAADDDAVAGLTESEYRTLAKLLARIRQRHETTS